MAFRGCSSQPFIAFVTAHSKQNCEFAGLRAATWVVETSEPCALSAVHGFSTNLSLVYHVRHPAISCAAMHHQGYAQGLSPEMLPKRETPLIKDVQSVVYPILPKRL